LEWDEVHSLPGKGTVCHVAVEVIPDGASLSIKHREHAVFEAEYFKGVPLAVDHGVEPDPRIAENSVCDQHGPAVDIVICDVMEPHHAQGISA
jgi:hypothetical protein